MAIQVAVLTVPLLQESEKTFFCGMLGKQKGYTGPVLPFFHTLPRQVAFGNCWHLVVYCILRNPTDGMGVVSRGDIPL